MQCHVGDVTLGVEDTVVVADDDYTLSNDS